MDTVDIVDTVGRVDTVDIMDTLMQEFKLRIWRKPFGYTTALLCTVTVSLEVRCHYATRSNPSVWQQNVPECTLTVALLQTHRPTSTGWNLAARPRSVEVQRDKLTAGRQNLQLWDRKTQETGYFFLDIKCVSLRRKSLIWWCREELLWNIWENVLSTSTAAPLRMPMKTGGCRVVLDDVSSHEQLQEALN